MHRPVRCAARGGSPTLGGRRITGRKNDSSESSGGTGFLHQHYFVHRGSDSCSWGRPNEQRLSGLWCRLSRGYICDRKEDAFLQRRPSRRLTSACSWRGRLSCGFAAIALAADTRDVRRTHVPSAPPKKVCRRERKGDNAIRNDSCVRWNPVSCRGFSPSRRYGPARFRYSCSRHGPNGRRSASRDSPRTRRQEPHAAGFG